MRRIRGSVVVVVILTCFAGVIANAQPLVDRVPQDAVVYIGFAGSESMGAGYAGSHLKAVLDASDLPRLMKESVPRFLENLGHQDEDAATLTGLLATIGGPMLRHPSAIYFGGVDVTNPDVPMPKLAVLCEAGAEAKQLVTDVEKLLNRNGPPPIPYRIEEQDGLVVLVIGNVDLSAKKKTPLPLKGRKEFQTAMAQVGRDPVAAIFIDAEGAVEQIDHVVAAFAPAEAKPKWTAIRDAIGLTTLKRIAITGGFDEKEWSTQAYVEAPEPRAGLVKALLESRPLSDDALRAIPVTATIATAGHLDLGGMLGTVREMVKKIDPAAGQEFEQTLDEVKQVIGMDVQTDVLDTLGDEWAMYSDPEVGGTGVLGMTLVNHLKDPAKAESALSTLERLLNSVLKENLAAEKISMAFTTTKQGGLTIHYFAVPFVAPSWAIKDGNLYLGLYPQVVSGAAEHVTTKGKSILDNPQFVALRKRLGGQNVSAVSYTDLPRTAAEGYQEVLMLSRLYLGMADLLGAKTPAMAFPTLSKLMPHVTPVAAVAWSDATGWHAKEVSPFPGSEILQSAGMGTIMAAEQAMMVGVALPALNRPRMTSNRVKSASNLRQIGQGMLLYANENRGKYPKTMGEIFLTEDLTIEVFVNPETKNQPPRDKNKDEQALWVNTSSDYEYLGAGKTSSATADVILAHEKIRPNAQGINILYGDGHVEFVQLPQAQQMIATQKAKDGKQARNGNDTRSASNLRQIGQGLLLHSNQANGKYPTTLGELILTQDFAVGSFVNPDLKARPLPRDKDKEEQAAWVNKEGDYEYLGTGKTNKSGVQVILAYEKFRPDAQGVNVLFGDGHVEWVETGDARQRIAAQQKQDEALKGLK